MHLKLDDGIIDDDLGFLRDMFTLLDARLSGLQKRSGESTDPDGMGLCDQGEYLAGMGFVACQRYLASTYGQHGLAKDEALKIGPYHVGGESFVSIINAVANLWKHSDEWDWEATIARDIDRLKPKQRNTIRIIQSVTEWSNYTCANVLYELTGPDFQFSALIPFLDVWRDQMDSALVG